MLYILAFRVCGDQYIIKYYLTFHENQIKDCVCQLPTFNKLRIKKIGRAVMPLPAETGNICARRTHSLINYELLFYMSGLV